MSVMWGILSALFILAFWGMRAILNHRNVTFTAWQWVGYLVWLLWTLFGVALVWTFIGERESRAVKVGALILGGPSVIVAIVLALLWVFP